MARYKYTRQAQQRRYAAQVKRATMLIIFCLILLVAGLTLPSHCADRHDNVDVNCSELSLQQVVTNSDMDEQLVHYTGMTVSFNPTMHVPNWVAYELTANETYGDEPRYNNFAADNGVKGCPTPDDYRNTGFDRGHMAPAADMKWSPTAMKESFYMTNIAPQANALNRGAWSKLEDKCRQRARRDSAIIIVSGPILTDPVEMHIGATGVAVPQRFFKVILSLNAEHPQAIGFIMPNGYVTGGMQACAVSVDSVETVTGHDFFSALPDEIENKIESQFNFDRWSRMK